MSWNYRILKVVEENGDKSYAIHEVYYDKDGKPDGHTEDEVSPHGETLKGFKKDLEHYKKALERAIVVYDEKNKTYYEE